ncbi:MAG: phospho-N-acetylmuramoyl-pentapeptide-transferase, partial [Armatimonadetes bacterium]|nr:phospho-N-acetylmuramoyl-pentapeptide-transferase [Armatimonadota bacterium]
MNGTVWLSFAIGFATTVLFTWMLLPFLRRLKGETIREDVPERHRLKAGTPTMGGIAFALSIALTFVAVSILYQPSLLVDALLFSVAMLSFAFVGFADDWAKLKRRKGWRTQPKLAAQIALAVLWVAMAKRKWALT